MDDLLLISIHESAHLLAFLAHPGLPFPASVSILPKPGSRGRIVPSKLSPLESERLRKHPARMKDLAVAMLAGPVAEILVGGSRSEELAEFSADHDFGRTINVLLVGEFSQRGLEGFLVPDVEVRPLFDKAVKFCRRWRPIIWGVALFLRESGAAEGLEDIKSLVTRGLRYAKR